MPPIYFMTALCRLVSRSDFLRLFCSVQKRFFQRSQLRFFCPCASLLPVSLQTPNPFSSDSSGLVRRKNSPPVLLIPPPHTPPLRLFLMYVSRLFLFSPPLLDAPVPVACLRYSCSCPEFVSCTAERGLDDYSARLLPSFFDLMLEPTYR